MGSLAARPHKSSDSPTPTTAESAAAFAERPPDENSPFFLNPRMAKITTTGAFIDHKTDSAIAVYPKAKDSPDSAMSMFTGFFTGMFSSIHIRSLTAPPENAKLIVEPASFSRNDRRELNVTYSIFNNTKNLARIEYPSAQHIEILTYDAQGKVVDRWSDDRSFAKQEEIVIINPHERIEYQEKIPTREMKAGEPYKIEATVASEPNYISRQTVTPK